MFGFVNIHFNFAVNISTAVFHVKILSFINVSQFSKHATMFKHVKPLCLM